MPSTRLNFFVNGSRERNEVKQPDHAAIGPVIELLAIIEFLVAIGNQQSWLSFF